ncbi:RNA polymerase sigma factor [Virgibacillus sp. DJP39]|uniref:RNA polymerase sigma factor n=1 Tax=Virgibacillus sp. DJP39 TaxID=3409790 RepID=UPI003BB5154B
MDETLIEKVKSGNDHAFRLLVEKYRIHIYKSVYAVLRNHKDTEDAVQEVFLKIYHALPQYKNQGFKTWITRIAVNHAIDSKRKHIRRQEDIQIDNESSNLNVSQTDSLEQVVLDNEMKRLVRNQLNELPDNYREVMIGYYINEKTHKQLAEEQQVQIKSIETKLYRARQWIRKHWKEEDFS